MEEEWEERASRRLVRREQVEEEEEEEEEAIGMGESEGGKRLVSGRDRCEGLVRLG